MIASMIAKRTVRRSLDLLSQDDYDVNAFLADWTDDAVYDVTSELGVGETLTGKKALAEWFQRWKKEFPKRKFVVKNICFSAWPLSPTNVYMFQWNLTQTDRQGREFKYDGVSVLEMKNFKVTRSGEHISFKGLPPISSLIKPTGKVQA